MPFEIAAVERHMGKAQMSIEDRAGAAESLQALGDVDAAC